MEVTTSIEGNPKSKTIFGGNLRKCISSINIAIWAMFFSFKEEAHQLIDHASIKIDMANDGAMPCSVTIKIKIKGSDEVYSFKKDGTLTFDANKNFDSDYKNLGKEIEEKTKDMVTDLFVNVISNLGKAIREMKV